MKTSITYDNQGNVTAQSTSSGNGALTSGQTMTYDARGNLLTVDGPLPGTADTTRYRYNGAREVVGVVEADPDGAGPLKHRATRNTYTNALLTKVELGTVNSQSDTDWNAFAPAQAVDTVYNANARVTSRKVSAGGTEFSLTQFSYDALGRPDCTAIRMNPGTFSTLPTSACTLGTAGSFGPDRISKVVYDTAGQVTQQRVAVGTVDEAAERSLTYTSNGQLATLTDGENNRTTYEYDGHDRLLRTRFPVTTKGANASSTTDFEQAGYDPAGNRISWRKRDGRTFTFNFDNLNRITSKIVPDGCAPIQVGACAPASATRDVYYSYDLLGRMLTARFDSQSGDGVTMAYDALSRPSSSTISMAGLSATLGYQFDAAGNRTRLTHPDGVYFTTNYDPLSRATGASWTTGSGTTSFLGIAYDHLGRRTSTTRGSSSTGYGFDGVSRLTSLTQNFAGGVGNATSTFGYNPASQVTSESRDNDSFAWTSAVAVNRNYTANGLNQYTAAGPATFTHDANGNLTADGTTTYVYDAENRLVSASNGTTLDYDPLGRLWKVEKAGVSTRFVYDGDQLAAEYGSSGAMTRRHYLGPSVDEPILEDPGGSLQCTNGTRFMNADRQGSVVAQADCWGNRTSVNSYDEYGIPASTNVSRFQYTGQAWLPEVGLYYYKARFYSPTLGRFLQTDPLSYGDGSNMYSYVQNDASNRIDPTGLKAGDPFPTRFAAAHDATLTYFNGKSETGGWIYKRTDLFGNVSYFAQIAFRPTSATSGVILDLAPGCVLSNCERVAGWHTHVYSTVFSPADRKWVGKKNYPLFLGFAGMTYIQLPFGHGQVPLKDVAPDLPTGFRIRDSLGSTLLPRSTTFVLSPNAPSFRLNSPVNFGPLNTIGLVAYENQCLFGDVDVCAGMEGFVTVQRREATSE